MHESSSDRNLVEVLAAEYMERRRLGERPSVEDYARRHPEHAEEIRDLFPALLMMEDLKPDSEEPVAGEAAPPPLEFDQLGDFRIIREVGRGGMGVVYEAEQISLGRYVAIKVLPQGMLRDPRQKIRFEREARAAAKLHHTNIVPVFGVGEDRGMGYYVMQFIQGLGLDEVMNELVRQKSAGGDASGSLGSGQLRVSRRGTTAAAAVARSLLTGEYSPQPEENSLDYVSHLELIDSASAETTFAKESTAANRLSDTHSLSDSAAVLPGRQRGETRGKKQTYWDSVAQIGIQAASALEYAHSQGVLHRDIKPANLLLDTQGTVWVTDFGLAKVDDEENLTHTGDILGTLRYMPPEAFVGRTDARGDVYSLGVTLYELLALRVAFGERERNRLIHQVTTAEPPRLEKVNPEIPRDLATIVHKAIARDPADRYQTAADLLEDLHRFHHDAPIQARPLSSLERLLRWRRRNPYLAVAIAVAVLALAATSMVSLFYAAAQKQLAEEQQQAAWEEHKAQLELKAKNLDLEREVERADANHYRSLLHRAQAHDELTRPEVLSSYQGAPERLGWEYYQLWPASVEPQWSTPAFRPQFRRVAWCESSGLIAVGGPPYVRILDPQTGRTTQVLVCGGGGVRDLQWNPAGDRLVIVTGIGQVKVYGLAQPQPLLVLPTSHPRATSVAWSPDGGQLAVTRGKVVDVVEAETGKLVRRLEQTEQVASASWSPQGDRFCVCSRTKIQVWTAGSGQRLLQFESADWLRLPAWSADGSRLAAVTRDALVVVWDVDSETPVCTLRGHQQNVTAVCWIQTGATKAVATCSRDGDLRIWNPESGDLVRAIRGDQRGLLDLAYRQRDESLVTLGMGGVIQRWPLLPPPSPWAGVAGRVHSVRFDAAGGRLAVAHEKSITIIDQDQPDRPPVTLTGHQNYVRSLAWSPNGRWLASASFDHTVRIWDAATGRLVHTLDSNGHSMFAVAWNSGGDRLAAGGSEKIIRVWDVSGLGDDGEPPASLAEAATVEASGSVLSLDWNPEGRRLAAAIDNVETPILIVNPTTGETDAPQTLHNVAALRVSWSPDGQTLAAGFRSWGDNSGRMPVLQLLDYTGQEAPRELVGHTAALSAVAWNPAGDRLVSSSQDGKVIVWDARSGQSLLDLQTGFFETRDVAWNPDSTQIAAANYLNGYQVWDASPGYAIHRPAVLLASLQRRLRSGSPRSKDLRLGASIAMDCGEWDEAEKAFVALDETRDSPDEREILFASSWWVAGPIKTDLHSSTDLEERHTGSAAQPLDVRQGDWIRIRGEGEGILNFGQYFDFAEEIAGYAYRRYFATEECEVHIIYGADDSSRLWLNGQLQHENQANQIVRPDAHVVRVRFQRGWNDVLVKVYNAFQRHGLAFRVSRDPAEILGAYSASRNFDEGLAEAAELFRSDPLDVTLPIECVRFAVNSGDTELVEQCLQRVRDANVDSSALEWLEFFARVREAGPEQAVRIIQEQGADADLLSDEFVDLQTYLLCWLGRWSEASQSARRALELDPTNDIAWLRLGPILLLAGDREGYREHCRQAIEQFRNVENAASAERIGKLLLLDAGTDEFLAEAEELTSRSLRIREGSDDPLLPWSYVSQALLAVRKERYEQAMAWCDRVRAWNPDEIIEQHANVLSVYARYHLGETTAALEEFEKMLQPTRRIPSHDIQIAEILRREMQSRLYGEEYRPYAAARDLFYSGRYEEAIEQISQVIVAAPERELLHHERALWSALCGRFDQSAEDWRVVIQAEPDNALHWQKRLAALAAAGNRSEFEKTAREALAHFEFVFQRINGQGRGPSRQGSRIAPEQALIQAERVAKSCLLLPVPDDIVQQASRYADAAVNARSFSQYRVWFHFAKGLAAFRSQDLSTAEHYLQLAWDYNTREHSSVDANIELLRAMIAHRQGRGADAESLFRRAEKSLQRDLGTDRFRFLAPVDWEFCLLFYEEARSELGVKPLVELETPPVAPR